MKRILLAAVVFLAAHSGPAVSPKVGGSRNVAVLIFPGVQIIDYTGPWEVFGHASVNGRPAFRIYSVAATASPIETAMGMTVIPSFSLARAPKPDVLVIPGGDVSGSLEDEAVIRWIQVSAHTAEVVLSVCNGAFLLARAGLLDGLEATTFAGMIEDLKHAAPKTKVVRDRRFVDNGKIVTSAGLSSGIDGSLHVIEKLYGKGTAQVAALGMEYDWRPDSGYARANLADRYLAPAYETIRQYPRSVVSHEGTRDRWETSWKIEAAATPAAILERLDAAFDGRPGWTRQGRSGAGGASESRWMLRDPEGKSWLETTRVEWAAGGKDCRVTVTLARLATG